MKYCVALIISTGILAAQTAPKNPMIETSKVVFGIAKNDILKSADKIPDELWAWKPTDSVRTFGQLFAHIADAQYEFCGVATGGKSLTKNIEKTAKGKADIMAAVKEAFGYCDDVYAKLNDTNAADLADFFGRKITKIGAMDFNTAHTMEHYGNLVTYMRLKNIVPPSSQQ
jgi:uncharacterized damage-inducible protein DinB